MMSDLVERLWKSDEASSLTNEAARKIEKLEAALNFYADPETYHACTFLFDRPTGGFDDDFSDDHGHEDYDRPMPGTIARDALKGI